jgi:hypothetical protein
VGSSTRRKEVGNMESSIKETVIGFTAAVVLWLGPWVIFFR